MPSYIGRHAELYDLFYSDKPYQKEAEFISQCIFEYGFPKPQRILELACGTGNHALELEKLGHEITAIDNSEDMIKQAKIKALNNFSKIDFSIKDIKYLPVYENPFDAVICLFDSIGYLLSNDTIKDTLIGVRNNLKDKGLFIFEFWHAAAMIKAYEPIRVKRFHNQDGEIIRISETSINIRKQIGYVNYTILEYRKNGTYLYTKENQKNRFFLIQEITLFLKICGFKILKFFNGYSKNEKINENSWHILAIAQK